MNIARRRQMAAQACINRFHGLPYAPGVRDCVKMAAHDLHHLGVKVPFLKGLRWRSDAEGLRVLRAAGFRSLVEAVDAVGLKRIPPAMAVPSDIIALPTSHALGALGIAVGNGNVLAFTDHSPNAEVLARPSEFVCAWRALRVSDETEGFDG